MNENPNNELQDSLDQKSPTNPSIIKLQELLRKTRAGVDPILCASDDQLLQYIERSQRSSENTSNEQKTANYDFLKLSYSAKGSASRVSASRASKGALESSTEGDAPMRTEVADFKLYDQEPVHKKLEMLSPARQ